MDVSKMIHRLKTYQNGVHGDFFLEVAELLTSLISEKAPGSKVPCCAGLNDFASLADELEKEGGFLDTPTGYSADKTAGQAYKDCAKRIREIKGSLNIELEKLELKDGDIVIVKYSDAMSQADLVDFTKSLIESPVAQGKKDIQMVLVAGDMDIKAVDENAMNEAGWFKLPKDRLVLHIGDLSEAEVEKLKKVYHGSFKGLVAVEALTNYYYRCPEDQFEWKSEHSVSACPKCNGINKSIYNDRKKNGGNPPVPRVILLEGQTELKGDSLYSRRQA
jgi:Zn finger protein HypA/HybF involved in hydrogenase expression